MGFIFFLLHFTYNVNFGAAFNGFIQIQELEQSISAMMEADGDICLLQEITPDWENQLKIRSIVSKVYPFMLFQQECGNWCAGGQAILSKFPVENLSWSESSCGWFPGWIAKLQHPGWGPILLLNLHLRPPLPAGTGKLSILEYFSSRNDRGQDVKKWMNELNSFQPKTKSYPIVVAGDFNEESTGKSGNLLRSLGLEDGVNQHDTSITWKWPLLNGWFSIWGRYDHIFYSKEHFSCKTGKVISKGASDHFPVFIELLITK